VDGGVEKRAASDAIGCVRKYVDSPSICSPDVLTTKTRYGTASR
jgi:hypothetical protein